MGKETCDFKSPPQGTTSTRTQLSLCSLPIRLYFPIPLQKSSNREIAMLTMSGNQIVIASPSLIFRKDRSPIYRISSSCFWVFKLLLLLRFPSFFCISTPKILFVDSTGDFITPQYCCPYPALCRNPWILQISSNRLSHLCPTLVLLALQPPEINSSHGKTAMVQKSADVFNSFPGIPT